MDAKQIKQAIALRNEYEKAPQDLFVPGLPVYHGGFYGVVASEISANGTVYVAFLDRKREPTLQSQSVRHLLPDLSSPLTKAFVMGLMSRPF